MKCEDSTGTAPKNLRILGRSVQTKITGVQLILPINKTVSAGKLHVQYESDKSDICTITRKEGVGQYAIAAQELELKAGTYVLGYDKLEGDFIDYGFIVIRNNNNDTIASMSKSTNKAQFKIEEDMNVSLQIMSGNTAEGVGKIYGLMLYRYDGKAFKWEPYTGGKTSPNTEFPQPIINAGDQGVLTVTLEDGSDKKQSLHVETPNGLPGIPTDNTGNYTDENGQQWVCDEIDIANEEYIQRIEFVNAKDLDWKYDPVGTIKRFSVAGVENIKLNGALISNRFIKSVSANKSGLCSNEEQGKIRVCFSDLTSTQQAVDFFQKNDTVFFYELETPIRHDLSDKVSIIGDKNLKMYCPTTIVSNDGNAFMEITYMVDTKAYIDAKISEISKKLI